MERSAINVVVVPWSKNAFALPDGPGSLVQKGLVTRD